MEDIVRGTLLFDFYGDLLTPHQQRIYEQVVCNDTGYSEVAESEGISRQGVHDLIRRCQKQLEGYEASLHLVEKFRLIQDKTKRIREEAEAMAQEYSCEELTQIRTLADEILKEL